MRQVSEHIAQLPDEDIPNATRNRILKPLHAGHGKHATPRKARTGWIKWAAILALGTCLLLGTIYFLYAHIG